MTKVFWRKATGLLRGIGLAIAFGSAGLSSALAASQPLQVVATVGMVADAVRAVGGVHVEVETLIGTGVDPHSYRQTRSDVIKLGRAQAIFANGLFLEAQLEDLLDKLSNKKPVFFVGEAVPVAQRVASEDYKDRFDPHVWMSPRTWQYAVSAVEAALTELQPENRTDFAKNAENYGKKLARLRQYAAEVLASIPSEKRVLITAHDAFTYMGRDFDMQVVGIQGISTNSEAGLRRIEQLVDLLVENKITAVFVESSVSERNVKALIEGAAARGHAVTIGGELFSDAMGAPGTYEGTYIGMIDHNATIITRALSGTAPARGMNGKLATSGH
ncbi:metal ABC transporter solute-binding protein, Zn/Mn family [Polycladidibacter hongkongensis]|uniref:metal ABC transporter solute-binding protein, Zn/Mn family n=1 Tax=Polycladidibacter hongkongensis TaxID=1647556 RepID=UPI00082AD8B0|nr:zinc ABC transporter substrate-binding protein [Pseudovibrio hongkongensis]